MNIVGLIIYFSVNLRRYNRLIGGDEGRIKLALPSSMSPLLLEVELREAKSDFDEDLVKHKRYRENIGRSYQYSVNDGHRCAGGTSHHEPLRARCNSPNTISEVSI